MHLRKLMLARFPGNDSEHPDSSNWVIKTYHEAKTDPRFSDVLLWHKSDTPITMTRNLCVQEAKKFGVDILVMIDSDMCPDLKVPDAKPFFQSTMDFMFSHDGPCIVAAPYVGRPPHENIYVFQWATYQSDNPNPDLRLAQFGREEAAIRAGFEEVGALATGLIAIDMRVFDSLKPPYFYYEWTDLYQQAKASTEDVTFTRDVSLAGIPIFVNWDSWAGHWKPKCCSKPAIITVEDVRESFRDALVSGRHRHEKEVSVNAGVPSWKLRYAKHTNGEKPKALKENSLTDSE